ncbi:related to YER185w, Rta1p [Rhynchosporium graminicola]|uniref:Related to YER185w, Rta1p n=1 Tax=Rhynchosporium graminicola TaxID=2792576 RepID=A0A1E1L8M0_9HELO|nr:related to YER185w, Rta1p [Rhynchosporium commune]
MSDGRPSRGYVDPNFPNPMGPNDATIIIYGYTPNFAFCILGTVCFALLFFAHLFQTLRSRLWSFIPLTIACVMEVVGYVFRAFSSRKDPYRVTFFVVQYFLIVTAPVLISASIYVCLTRIVGWAGDAGLDLSTRSVLLRKKVVLWTFITIDVFCTILQITGAGMIGGATSNGKDPSTANNILLAGLAIQTAAYFLYLLLLSFVIVAIYRDRDMALKLNKSPFLLMLAAASILIFIRTVFRLAETSQGVFGHLSSHEAYFGGLEFAPVVIAVLILAVWFPSRWPATSRRIKVESA